MAARVVTTSTGGNWHANETVGVDDQEIIRPTGRDEFALQVILRVTQRRQEALVSRS
jgi:hypothetical protein